LNIKGIISTALPIIQAPMAGVQGAALAVAVSRAGGLGSLPAAMLSRDALRAQLGSLARENCGPINVNFFCHVPPVPDHEREAVWRTALLPYYTEFGLSTSLIQEGTAREPFTAELCDVLGEFRPAVVSFHFGLPSEQLLGRVRSTGARILSSATTVEEARWLERRGVDAVIAQGLEAGGHRGHFLCEDLSQQSGLFALLPQIVRAVRVPVIAAGGIADADGVAAALSLGASAVQLGTAYLLCAESTTSPVHRALLGSEAALHTALTNLFSGRPARGVINRLMRELGALSDRVLPFPLAANALLPLRRHAEALGRGDFSPLWAGQNVSGCRPIGAGELTRQLAARIGAG
jgi:nitronate monooxygenase